MKKQKGITLIALVITIIVMLVLVGVTISVSLNGGLFTTAKEAAGETQIAKEKEELLMVALGALNENGRVDIGKLDSSLPDTFTGSNGEYTSKTGNVFKVSENGSITLEGEEQPDTPVTPPEVQEYKLSGTWKFNDKLTPPNEDLIQLDTYFTCKFDDIEYTLWFIGLDVWGAGNEVGMNYWWGDNPGLGYSSGSSYIAYDAVGGFEGDPFAKNLKTITFTSEQEVSQEFYEWFIANATQQQS